MKNRYTALQQLRDLLSVALILLHRPHRMPAMLAAARGSWGYAA